MGKCILIGAGDLTVSEISVSEEDYVIAVDGGMDYLEYLQVEPDLILGDFDSVSEKMQDGIKAIEQTNPEKVRRLNPIKDDTDMLAALRVGLEKGYRDFRIYAALGGRLDHSIANLQCLGFLKDNEATGYLCDGDGLVLLIRNESVSFKENMEGTLSLFSTVKETKGVTISGMKYNLDHATITNSFPIGVSNEFVGEEATITVTDGELICMIRYE